MLIAVGKEADLVVLSSDISVCDPETIADAEIMGTMVGGQWVYTPSDASDLAARADRPAVHIFAHTCCTCALNGRKAPERTLPISEQFPPFPAPLCAGCLF